MAPHQDPFSLVVASTTTVTNCAEYTKSFGNLIEAISSAKDPLQMARNFLYKFLDRINSDNGSSLGIEDACRLLRQNVELVPNEYRETFLVGVNTIELNDLLSGMNNINPSIFMARICWPWEWNWFGLNKKDKNHHHRPLATFSPSVEKIIVFAIIIAGITTVAIFNAPALGAATEAMFDAVKILGL